MNKVPTDKYLSGTLFSLRLNSVASSLMGASYIQGLALWSDQCTMYPKVVISLTLMANLAAGLASFHPNETYTNPVFPGWHSDPTCAFVPEWDNTFFCTASTFLAFPGLPIYASKDLKNWKLVSHVINRLEPIRDLVATTINQKQGI